MGRDSKGTHVLRKVRERIGWYQKELAEQTGLGKRTIQDVERGPEVLKLSPRNAQKISAVTGVSTDYLLTNDPDREIINTAGEPWSPKDIKAIKQRAEEWPGLSEMEIFLRAGFFNQLLLDYYKLRCALLATGKPLTAFDSWREYRERAWIEFLKEWPEAKWDNPEAIKPADAHKWKEDWKAGTGRHPTGEGRLDWQREIETAKNDAEFVLEHPLEPRSGPDADAALLELARILTAAWRGEGPRHSGSNISDDFLESERTGRPYIFKPYTFDGFHDGAKMPQELVREIAAEADQARQHQSDSKPAQESKNKGATKRRRAKPSA